jgi:hypothetical protein
VISSGLRCVWHQSVALFDYLTAIRCVQLMLRNVQPWLHALPAAMV